MRGAGARLAAIVLTAACARRSPPAFTPPPATPDLTAALYRYAPVFLQEVADDPRGARWDQPTPFDPDGSGGLADDADAVVGDASSTAPLYALGRADDDRYYLFYGLYYPADWSGPAAAPRIDHRGDFEGALVVVSRAAGAVEAVVTQAHGRFYLWRGDRLPRTDDGRPRLFAESGGHGLYAFIDRPWRAKGGRTYPRGPAGVPRARLRILDVAAVDATAELRAFNDVLLYAEAREARFRGLPRGAKPPWHWRGGGAAIGAIVRDPAALYARLAARSTALRGPRDGAPDARR